MTKKKIVDLIESFPRGEMFAEATVEGNVISNASLLGPRSLNNRVYTHEAMQDAVRLYNGVQIFVDHPNYDDLTGTGGRRFMDLAGKVVNTRLSGDRVRGDVITISNEPIGEKLRTIAVEMPDVAGFSHRARGETEAAEDGTVIVKRITDVAALEIVTDPATVVGLFESKTPKEEDQEMKISEITLAQLKAENPTLIEEITTSVKTGLEESIRKEVLAEVDDGKKIEALEAKVTTLETEKKDLSGKLDAAEIKEAARTRDDLISSKLDEAKLPETAITDRFMKTLREAKDEEAIDALIDDRKSLVEGMPKGKPTPNQPVKSVEKIIEGEMKDGSSVTPEVVESAYAGLFR